MTNRIAAHRNCFYIGRALGPLVVVFGCALLLGGCATPHVATSAPPPPPHSVILAPGDVLKLTFPGAPEFTQVQKIRSDGRISLPVLGEVRAAGKTVGTLQSQLVGLYKEQLTDSEVIVALESGGARVYMGGAVLKPGPLVLDQPTTILQAIMLAGGPNQFANMGRVQIIRLVSGQERTEVIDLRPTLAGTTTHPYYVHDGDVISVPQKAF